MGFVICILSTCMMMAADSDESINVIVDGKDNCLLLSSWSSLKIEAGPGPHFFNTFPGTLPRIGENMPHDCAFVRSWDHQTQKVEYGAVYFGKKREGSALHPGAFIHMKTSAGIKGVRYHVFFVDKYKRDNDGGIRFKLDHKKIYEVDTVKHALDPSNAKKVDLTPGEWNVKCSRFEVPPLPIKKLGIRLAGPQSELHNQVLLRAHFHSGFDQYGIVTPDGLFNPVKGVHGTLMVPVGGAAVYVFCVDEYIEDNSGKVEVTFHKVKRRKVNR
jgi:hypothetical protein